MSQGEMDTYRELIRENICYDDFVREHPYDAGQLDEMVEVVLPKEKYPSGGKRLPPGGGEVRLLKLDDQHIRSVFDCLRENTTQVRNNALVTIESHYAAQVNHDFYGGETAT